MVSPTEAILNYHSANRRIRERLAEVATRAWWSLPAYRDVDIDRLVDIIVPQVLAGERQVAQLTDAYLSGMALKVAQGVDDVAVTGAATRGIAPEVVYRRPATTIYTELAAGASFPVARDAGLNRLLSLIATDLQLTQRLQERASLGLYGYNYYRRTLTGRENCLLCALAATQRYHRGDLKPIHPGCDCGVSPINAEDDPGQVLNEQMLEQIHESSGGDYEFNRSGRSVTFPDGSTRDYRDIVIRDHGEYGPTLTWRKDKFTGPSDIAA